MKRFLRPVGHQVSPLLSRVWVLGALCCLMVWIRNLHAPNLVAINLHGLAMLWPMAIGYEAMRSLWPSGKRVGVGD